MKVRNESGKDLMLFGTNFPTDVDIDISHLPEQKRLSVLRHCVPVIERQDRKEELMSRDPDEVSYDDLTVNELRDVAIGRGIELAGYVRKADLIDLLEEYDGRDGEGTDQEAESGVGGSEEEAGGEEGEAGGEEDGSTY